MLQTAAPPYPIQESYLLSATRNGLGHFSLGIQKLPGTLSDWGQALLGAGTSAETFSITAEALCRSL